LHPRAAVTGKVTIGGRPLPGGIIYFFRAEDNHDSATVYIRSDGTYETKSAPVGKCKVSVKTAHLNPVGNAKPPEYYVQVSGDPRTGKQYVAIPAKYDDAEKSGLEFDITDGATINIPLAEK
jgi:hypothetical protein